jgi:type I restriction enzyme M protein
MSTKRDVLAHLTRDELLAVVDRFTLAVPDRRANDGLLEAVAASKKATLAEILPGYARERLKELCRALGLDDGGKEKAAIVERIVGAKAESAPIVRASGVKASVATPASEQIELVLGARKLTIDVLERYV